MLHNYKTFFGILKTNIALIGARGPSKSAERSDLALLGLSENVEAVKACRLKL